MSTEIGFMTLALPMHVSCQVQLQFEVVSYARHAKWQSFYKCFKFRSIRYVPGCIGIFGHPVPIFTNILTRDVSGFLVIQCQYLQIY